MSKAKIERKVMSRVYKRPQFVSIDSLILEMEEDLMSMKRDLLQVRYCCNCEAAKRVRVRSIKFNKLSKIFRKKSMEIVKSKIVSGDQ